MAKRGGRCVQCHRRVKFGVQYLIERVGVVICSVKCFEQWL